MYNVQMSIYESTSSKLNLIANQYDVEYILRLGSNAKSIRSNKAKGT